ncbi:MAG: Rid family hydrolase [Pseudomonadales bacterium]|jgi:enamine deaminase RidA (YjgF/YER057c/UK114 family)|nr:Rid family hydrolase [Pseudomonadales bacterium]MDP6470837.1 Rid family hydrolase [Pseudomonadales bacterium]MDP6825978.1 Rid family hydrolase [Pseudomonadales bacterium]MDP6972290.1 Rid family hydrolase [Pseudomonadales bacterium]|tara:strand:- start:4343 stop:4699 length:357 start_codon:yes stop_codon:yes gene_type:complete
MTGREHEQKKQIVRTGPFGDLIASGLRIGDILTLAGQVGIDDEGATIGVGDICAQTRQAYLNVLEVLSEFGVAPDRIMDETWFATDIQAVMANVDAMLETRLVELPGSTTQDVSNTLV